MNKMKIPMLILLVFLATGSISVIFLSSAALTRGVAPDLAAEESGAVLGAVEENYGIGFPVALNVSELSISNPYIGPAEPIQISPSENLEITALKGIIADSASGKILFAKNADVKTPIASITKLMTALVFLENNPGWENIYKIGNEDRRDGGKIYLYRGDEVRVKDLFNLSLTASDNSATIAMVAATGMSELEFVDKMNAKAKELGLANTSFLEPVGLSMYNVSTAREVYLLLEKALEKDEITKALLAPTYEFYTLGNKYKIVQNTDILLENIEDGLGLTGAKTGYTESAGYCFASKMKNSENKAVVVVVLDDVSHFSRFEEAEKMAKWAYGNYLWQY